MAAPPGLLTALPAPPFCVLSGCAGNVLDDDHMGSLVRGLALCPHKAATCFFFHEHVTAILKDQHGKYELVDSLPHAPHGTGIRIACEDAAALRVCLAWCVFVYVAPHGAWPALQPEALPSRRMVRAPTRPPPLRPGTARPSSQSGTWTTSTRRRGTTPRRSSTRASSRGTSGTRGTEALGNTGAPPERTGQWLPGEDDGVKAAAAAGDRRGSHS